ncbi:MAG: hypothetical protein ACQES4_13060 [Bacillota bacterium]
MVKLIYISIMLFAQNHISANDTSSSIDEYIELSAELSRDTVYADSILMLTVVFENKTDSYITFYPKAILSIVRPLGGFEYDSYFLNNALDLRTECKIAPHAAHKETFKVHAEPPVFKKGMNYLHLYYLCKEQSGDFKKYNKLYGNLESEEFRIFIK